jgi:hypothetical protein
MKPGQNPDDPYGLHEPARQTVVCQKCRRVVSPTTRLGAESARRQRMGGWECSGALKRSCDEQASQRRRRDTSGGILRPMGVS